MTHALTQRAPSECGSLIDQFMRRALATIMESWLRQESRMKQDPHWRRVWSSIDKQFRAVQNEH